MTPMSYVIINMALEKIALLALRLSICVTKFLLHLIGHNLSNLITLENMAAWLAALCWLLTTLLVISLFFNYVSRFA